MEVLAFMAFGFVVMLLFFVEREKKLKSEVSLKATQVDNLDASLRKAKDELLQAQQDLKRYSALTDVEAEVSRLNKEAAIKTQDLSQLELKFQASLKIYQELEKEVAVYRSDLDLANLGMYQPEFSFYDKSEQYKMALEGVRDTQKTLLKANKAARFPTTWTVNNSLKEGERLVKRNVDLSLRAFNGEADSIISKVTWNNIDRSLERLEKSHAAINKLNKTLSIEITDEYLRLKTKELKLAYEYEQKKQQEKEEARQIREEMREAQKAEAEINKAKLAAEKEEATYQKALAAATKAAETAQGEKLNELQEQIAQLQNQLESVQAKERALSMAQQTKSGHVYVISNIGAFGERMFKVGMTRRLDPMDRVKELGDASVPFGFDVHAMVFSENAPELERKLHKALEESRVNRVNLRKEFFLADVPELTRILRLELGTELELAKEPEAREWRETQAMLKKLAEAKQRAQEAQAGQSKFPSSLTAVGV